jgi:tetratricopeptide (TPR) repeat protein
LRQAFNRNEKMLQGLTYRNSRAERLVVVVEATSVEALVESGLRERQLGNRAGALAAFEAATTLDPMRAGIKVELACELRALNRLDEAETLLQAVLDADPRNVGALVERAHIHRRRGNHVGAFAGFEEAAAAAPRHVGIRLELARTLRALDRLDDAEAALDRGRDVDDAHVGFLVERGHIRRLRKDHVGALAVFGAAAAVDPRNADLKMEFARELSTLGRLDEAAAVLRAIIDAEPRHIRALIEQAHVCRRRRDPAGTLTALEAAAQAAPADLDLRLELAAEYGAQNRSDEALQLIESVLAAEPDHVVAWMRLGQLHRSRGDRQRSIAAFRTAIEKRPNHAHALVELARETWAVGQPKPAQELLGRALSQDPQHLGAMVASAELSLLGGAPESALQLARRAIDLHPGQIGPYLLGARAAADLFNREEAERLLDQARLAFGFRPEIATAQIHLLRQYRDYDGARAVIAEAGDQARTNFGYWMQTTAFAIAQGDFNTAEQALNSAPAELPRETARVHFLRASLAEARRQYAVAVAGYQAAIALDGSEPEWHEAAARCYLLLADVNRTRDHLRAMMQLNAATRLSRGQSLNISQHHLGQLLDEFILDGQVLAKLKEFCTSPARKRIEPLRELVQNNPDNTAAAIELLLAMREAGILTNSSSDPPTGGNNVIPKRIVQYWHAETPPPDVHEIITSWRRQHPDYEHVLFNDTAAVNFLRMYGLQAALQAFCRGSTPAHRADILRLAYLSSLGGFFVDADDRCLARLDTFVSASVDFVGYQESYGTVGINFIGAAPGHPMMAGALDGAVTAVNRGDHDVAWLSTGPGLLTRCFAEMLSAGNAANLLGRTRLIELWEVQRAVGIYCPARYKQQNRRSAVADGRVQPRTAASSV